MQLMHMYTVLNSMVDGVSTSFKLISTSYHVATRALANLLHEGDKLRS